MWIIAEVQAKLHGLITEKAIAGSNCRRERNTTMCLFTKQIQPMVESSVCVCVFALTVQFLSERVGSVKQHMGLSVDRL